MLASTASGRPGARSKKELGLGDYADWLDAVNALEAKLRKPTQAEETVVVVDGRSDAPNRIYSDEAEAERSESAIRRRAQAAAAGSAAERADAKPEREPSAKQAKSDLARWRAATGGRA